MDSRDASSAQRIAELEAELCRRTEQLARAKAELIDFASVVGHDLRSPLLTISGYCDLLRYEYVGRLDESADHYLKSTIDGVARVNRLLEDLLGYARLQSVSCPTDKVELDQVVADALSNLDGAIGESGATVKVESLPCVRGNHGQLVQVFQNLVDNAVKFRGPDRPIIAVSAEPESDGHVVRVADNGVGIEPEHREVVFQIMRRLAKTRGLPGTGIGLAICRRIVECHGGRIWIESRNSAGATVSVWLPGAETTPSAV
ncbi:MAG: hypothetical protein JW888_11270 [Pirellulales bacterium]|nr:hypothetical protein [Pirellulales bacterium]